MALDALAAANHRWRNACFARLPAAPAQKVCVPRAAVNGFVVQPRIYRRHSLAVRDRVRGADVATPVFVVCGHATRSLR